MKILAVTIVLMVLLLIYNQKKIKVRHYDLLKKKGCRFLVLSDFHNNGLLPFNQFERILLEEAPDVIFLLGDLIDRKGGIKHTEKLLDILKDTGLPVFYVNGNHESAAPDALRLESELQFATCLEQQTVEFHELLIAGVEFHQTSSTEADITLCHNPMDAVKSNTSGLFLAGHTHGGQVRFPFLGAVYVPGQKFFPDYSKGYYKLGDKELLITSGLGNTLGPLRLLNPVEVIILT